MVTVETTTTRTNGITTVQIRLTNTQTTRQFVHLESTLDGPVWPPRRNGVVDPHWDGRHWQGTIPPDRSRGIGFATRAPPTDPPVEVVSNERYRSETSWSEELVLAELDGWSPAGAVLGRRR